MPLYEKIADSIARHITGGTLAVGERLPGVRRLSAQNKVSVSTAVQVYVTLEKRGLVDARPKTGFFVRPASRFLAPPGPRRQGWRGRIAHAHFRVVGGIRHRAAGHRHAQRRAPARGPTQPHDGRRRAPGGCQSHRLRAFGRLRDFAPAACPAFF